MSAPNNPYGWPFSGSPGGIAGNPIDGDDAVAIKCPTCKSQNYNSFTNEYGITRRCLESGCGQEWSGGGFSASQHPFIESDLLPTGEVAPDADMPVTQYTGTGFRDFSKTYGWDD